MKKLATLISFLIVGLVSYWSFIDMKPQKPLQESSDPTEFSMNNALMHLKNISLNVHHVGSTEHKTVQKYIVAELEKLGLKPHIQTQTVINKKWFAGTTTENIIAKIEGDQNSKSLVLLSHYDSGPHSSFGASDAGSGVVTILEGVRAFLAKNTKPKNDIIIVISDAEELGLLGAQAFVNHHEWAKNVGLVLNFEARGSGGPSYMLMETNGKNGKLLSEFVKANPTYPAANSLMYSIYKTLPNDTDLTVFREQGDIEGFNFAFIGDHFDYHTAQDTYQRIDHTTLSHQADYFTTTLNHFAYANLNDLKSDKDYVYVNFPGIKLLSYPFSWVYPMLIGACMLLLVILFFGISLNRLNGRAIAKGLFVFLGMVIIQGGISFGLWKFITMIHPGYTDILHGFTYNGYEYIAAFFFLNLWLGMKLYQTFARKNKIVNLLIGPVLIWIIINGLIAAYLKGAGFFIIPVFFALLILMIEVFMNLEDRSKKMLFTILSIPTIYMFAPTIKMFPVGLGLKNVFISAIIFGLVFGLLIQTFHLRKTKWPIKFSGVFALVFFGLATFNSGFDTDKKKPNSLVYVQNMTENKAFFGTYNSVLDDFTNPYFGDTKEGDHLKSAETKSKYTTRFTYATETENRKIPTSSISIELDTVIEGKRFLDLRITPARKVNKYEFSTRKKISLDGFKVNGALVNEGNTYSRNKGTFLVYHMGNSDQELRLSFSLEVGTEVPIIINEISYDLLANSLFDIKPRTKEMMPMPFITNDAIIVTNEVTF